MLYVHDAWQQTSFYHTQVLFVLLPFRFLLLSCSNPIIIDFHAMNVVIHDTAVNLPQNPIEQATVHLSAQGIWRMFGDWRRRQLSGGHTPAIEHKPSRDRWHNSGRNTAPVETRRDQARPDETRRQWRDSRRQTIKCNIRQLQMQVVMLQSCDIHCSVTAVSHMSHTGRLIDWPGNRFT